MARTSLTEPSPQPRVLSLWTMDAPSAFSPMQQCTPGFAGAPSFSCWEPGRAISLTGWAGDSVSLFAHDLVPVNERMCSREKLLARSVLKNVNHGLADASFPLI